MKPLSSKQILLALLAVALGIVLYIQYQKGAFTTRPRRSQAQAVRAALKQSGAPELVPVVGLNLEPPEPMQIRDELRNLFNYSRSPREIREERRRQAEMERLAREAAERLRVQQEEAARLAAERAAELARNPPPPPPPPISFAFIGKMGEPRSPIAILADVSTGGEIYTVKEGELIGDAFRLIKIDFDSVTIGYVNPAWSQETKTIRMGS